MKEQILQLRSEGKTYDEIKEILGCSKGTISYHCGGNSKQKSLIYGANRRQRNRDWIKQLKDSLQCVNCGESRNWVLEFHHTDPSKKELEVSNLILRVSKEKVLEEVKKCIVLCCNCHRDLHYKQRNE